MMAALALLLQQPTDKVDYESARQAVRYLARHQAEDGSWGRRPAHCTCPREPLGPPVPVDEPTRIRIAALIADLGDDDFNKRLAAQKAFAEIGPPSMPALQEAVKSGDFETRARASAALDAVELQLTAPDLELTALVLLLMSTAGYHSDWPRLEAGIHPGEVMKKGEAWLLARLNPEGQIRGADAAGQAIAALALNEDFLTCHRHLLKEPAEKSATSILADLSSSPRARFWQGWALASARFNGFPIDEKSREWNYQLLRNRWGEAPFSIAATLRAHLAFPPGRGLPDPPATQWILDLPPSILERESAYFASVAAWKADGPHGEIWTKWNTKLRAWLPTEQIKRGCAAGAWEGQGTGDRMRAAVYGGLTQQFFYHY